MSRQKAGGENPHWTNRKQKRLTGILGNSVVSKVGICKGLAVCPKQAQNYSAGPNVLLSGYEFIKQEERSLTSSAVATVSQRHELMFFNKTELTVLWGTHHHPIRPQVVIQMHIRLYTEPLSRFMFDRLRFMFDLSSGSKEAAYSFI